MAKEDIRLLRCSPLAKLRRKSRDPSRSNWMVVKLISMLGKPMSVNGQKADEAGGGAVALMTGYPFHRRLVVRALVHRIGRH